jgi:hypothetical protein
MRISRVLLDGDLVRCAAADGVVFEPVEEFGGEPVSGVSIAQLPFAEHGAVSLVHIAVNGAMPLHTGPESGFVQVVEGAGTLVLPATSAFATRRPSSSCSLRTRSTAGPMSRRTR